MSIGLFGHPTDRPDDPFVMVASLPMDQRLLSPEVAREKDRREDLQVWACLQALGAQGRLAGHPVATSAPDQDPPDRIWTVDGETFAVELTELTVEQLRGDLARARQLGRLLQSRLESDQGEYGHLAGRVASVTWMPDPNAAPEPKRVELDSVVDALAAALREDRGYVGEGIQTGPTDPLPAHWPNTRGFYGRVLNEYQLQTHQVGDPAGPPTVASSTNGTVQLSEAREGLNQRIAAKDDARNDIVVVTTGMVDSQGYICPLDGWLFQMLIEKGIGDVPEPVHLDGVLLHDFPTGAIASVYERRGARLPWLSPSS